MRTPVLTWVPGAGWAPAPEEPSRLLVADSWLLRDGAMRGASRHRYRFTHACRQAERVPAGEAEAFFDAALAHLPGAGPWFPRVELVGAPAGRRFHLRLRPAPARRVDAVVWVHGQGDPRTAPRVKGPDLQRLAELRALAVAAGAQEALLTTRGGFVLETTHSGVLWWEDGALCVPDPRLRLLSSVTSALIGQAATAQGIRVRAARRRVADLSGREVWLANALHGIRPVVGWVGAAVRAAPPVHAERWRAWWQASARPVSARPVEG